MQIRSFKKQATALVAGAFLSFGASVQAMPAFSDMYIFGDSLSDSGNVADKMGSLWNITIPYGENGRFSNGPVWHEHLSDRLGMARETFSRNGGNNYAYGGAKVDSGDFITSLAADSYKEQITDYTAGLGGNQADSNALYISWIGGNDIRGLVGESNTQSAIDTALDSLAGMLGNLLNNGVTNLLVPNLPDIGAIPEFAGNAANSAQASDLTNAWNAGLAQRLDTLYQTHQSAKIYHFDVHSLFQQMMSTPANFGFTDVTNQCRSVGGWFGWRYEIECSNADTTLFWDEIHPTTAAHNKLSEYAYNLLDSGLYIGASAVTAVSSPSAALLLLLGIGLIMQQRQRAPKAK